MVFKKKFSELTNKELWEIAMLRSSVFTIEQNIKEEELEINDYRALHFFYKVDDVIISYARLVEIDNSPYIGRVCSNRLYRNQGFQKQIIKKIINSITSNKKIYVSSQQHVVAFYLKFGFKKIGDTYLDAGITHQLLILEK